MGFFVLMSSMLDKCRLGPTFLRMIFFFVSALSPMISLDEEGSEAAFKEDV